MTPRRLLFSFLLILILPLTAMADETPAASDWRGFFIEPAFSFSAFVTDKGELQRVSNSSDFDRALNAHTGDYNWLLHPSLAAGYDFHRFIPAFRFAYSFQGLHLNLPYDENVDGQIGAIEVGPELYVMVVDGKTAGLEVGGGASIRLLETAILDSGEGTDRRELEGTDTPSFAAHLGIGGDFARTDSVSFGWTLRFYYGHYTLSGNDDALLLCGDTSCVIDKEELTLNVYSALVGLRMRFFTSASSLTLNTSGSAPTYPNP